MIAGQLAFTDDRGTCIVDSEDIVTAGFEPHLTSAISDEPARFLEIWVRAAVAARTVVRHARVERVERPTEVVATGGGSIRSVVLPVGAMLRHRNRTPSYVLSTVGRICVDGLIAGPAARVQLIGDGDVAITALESTEVVILHEPHCDPSFASRTAARASSSTSEQAARSRLGVFVDFA